MDLRTMTIEQLTAFGAPHLVYIHSLKLRDVPFDHLPPGDYRNSHSPEHLVFGVYSATGQLLTVTDSKMSATTVAVEHELIPCSLQ